MIDFVLRGQFSECENTLLLLLVTKVAEVCLHSELYSHIVLHILWAGYVIKWTSRMDTCLS